MRYRMDDGTVVDTKNATASYREALRHDGHNSISVATGSPWEHEMLYRSRRGRYWIEHASAWQGSTPYASWVSDEEAARWLLANGHDLPADLAELEQEVSE